MDQDTVLVADYHQNSIKLRSFQPASGQERLQTIPTEPAAVLEAVREARRAAGGAGVVFVMESTTGWARMAALLAGQARFELANVLAIPREPRATRRKTDTLDTARLLREYRAGTLPLSFQPRPALRRLRRLVGLRDQLVRRRTGLRNWVSRYLAHETWRPDKGLWSRRGMAGLAKWAAGLPGHDRFVLQDKLGQLGELEGRIRSVEARLDRVARRWGKAKALDAIYGIGAVSAVGIAACIGRIQRFAHAEALIAYAGLAPGVRQSDQTRRDGRIGGGGTDTLLRHLLIEASVWASKLPRYQRAYRRALGRRGRKVARLVVARMLVRSIDAVLRKGVAFDPGAAQADGPRPTRGLAGASA